MQGLDKKLNQEMATVTPPERSDRSTPNVVLARSPQDRNTIIRLYASPFAIRTWAADNVAAKMGEYSGLVHGNIVEEQEDGSINDGGTNGLLDAHALFKGIKRPRIKPQGDAHILVYVTNPTNSFVYPRHARAAKRVPKPLNSVFVTYAELFEDGIDRTSYQVEAEISGIVHMWEWVFCDPKEPTMPEESSSRYAERCW